MDDLRCASICVVIDVSKDRLDVHLRPSDEAFAVARDGKGLETLVERLRALDVVLIVLEATGGFETTVAAALAGAGLPLAVVNPCQIRDFARALGKLAKTDAIDAAVIAIFAEKMRPQARQIASQQAQTHGELVARRRQIVEMIGMEQNRRRRAGEKRLKKQIGRHIAVGENGTRTWARPTWMPACADLAGKARDRRASHLRARRWHNDGENAHRRIAGTRTARPP